MEISKEELLYKLNVRQRTTLMDTLHISYTDVGPDYLVAEMPVSPTVHQPYGVLHGGATAALAESVGSAASALFIDHNSQEVYGIEISCNHLRSVSSGMVIATAKAIHIGRSIHLWEILVKDTNGKLISHCKLTNMVVIKRN
ncbi:PaaI family thioesterase [Schleiferia thermophila]|uniref:PaaI family thioesterase n=1 Tax=Schleiferia thermophila TaxID=884107 RepID=UPI003EEF4EC1